MESLYRCVVDAQGTYQTFILLGTYEPSPGEQLLDVPAPELRMFAHGPGMLRPRWDGSQWVELATQEEIAAWDQSHPSPGELDPAPLDRLDIIEAQVSYTAMMTGTEIGG